MDEIDCKAGESSLLWLGILDLIGSGLRSGESCEGFLNARAIASGDIGSAQLVELTQEGVGVGELLDADADGRVDLWNNWSDVCASVGNYLKEFGWNAGEPVLSDATVDPGDRGSGPGPGHSKP